MRWSVQFFLLILLMAFLFLANVSLGSIKIPLEDILATLLGQEPSNPIWSKIILDFRLTKAVTCLLAGSALSIGGLQMQTLFRNALAGPDVLGLTSGASLAVALLYMGQDFGGISLPFEAAWGVVVAASIGCIVVFIIMFGLSRRLKDNVSLLIVGLMIGAATSSLVSVLQYVSKAEQLQTYMIWTMGSLGSLSWNQIQVLLIILLAGLLIAGFNIKALNAWLLGEQYASSIGVDIKRSRLMMIVSASMLTGSVTAFCGPIAFIGLAVPHLVKMSIRTFDHKKLLPSVMIGGATLLLFCDIICQLPGKTQILPINAITAMFGAPVVIWIILKNRIVQ